MCSLLPHESDKKLVLDLAHKSPRALIKLLGIIYAQEHDTDGVDSFRPDSLALGMLKYCKEYDYFSNQSVKIGGKNDIFSWINKILTMRRTTFTMEDLKKEYSLTGKKPQTYIQNMLKLSLIKENIIPEAKTGQAIYEVADPRLRFLISRGVTELC